jgi:pseudouridine-5'-phosphate glycosidase
VGSLRVQSEVARALDARRPVVALESALITHGFRTPSNLEIAEQMEAAVREAGAVPASIAVVDGQPRIGLSRRALVRLASVRPPGESSGRSQPRKISLRDLPASLAQGITGGTTVAATIHLAHLAGIQVLATGGVGGVHRDRPEDVSADLTALGSIPITVVCSGPKALLDLPRTRETLETKGITVIGYATEELPAFYSRRSGLKVDVSVDTPAEVAHLARLRTALGLRTALLVCVPVPAAAALSETEAETAILQAMDEAKMAGVGGKDLTPFLLGRIVDLTDGEARRANEALLVNNARVAALIAAALANTGSDG